MKEDKNFMRTFFYRKHNITRWRIVRLKNAQQSTLDDNGNKVQNKVKFTAPICFHIALSLLYATILYNDFPKHAIIEFHKMCM